MSESMKKVVIRDELISIFGDVCWMGYKNTHDNFYTYHHIKEKRNGGRVTVDNGAVLTNFAHKDLNRIGEWNKSYYNELNVLFLDLNLSRTPPSKEYFKEVNCILLFADRNISLSNYFNPNPDFVKQEEDALRMLEERMKKLAILIKNKQVFDDNEEFVYLSEEYKGLLKHNNRRKEIRYRNNSRYHRF